MKNPKCSIIICTYKRPKSLKECLDSLKKQTFTDYEIILHQEEGRLVDLKDEGGYQAKGEILIWIDDDVILPFWWLEEIVRIFDSDEKVVGVTGRTYVNYKYAQNRDILRNRFMNKLYNALFLYPYTYLPGRITPWGVNTIGANFDTEQSNKLQEVDFLEPCQFAIRKDVFRDVGGFYLHYGGVAEWCDVDLCFRIKKHGKLIYSPLVYVEHKPIKGDVAYNKRLDTCSRYQNYLTFSKRWIKPSLRHSFYKLFLKTYFYLKGKGVL
jgi:GT2 family glycosyltransferase